MRNTFFTLIFFFLPSFAFANVDEWVIALKKDAVSQGISSDLVNEAFEDFSPDENVIRLDKKQPESKISYVEYSRKVLPASRIERARSELSKNSDEIVVVAREYGVNPEVIVALWALESNFGERMGSYEVVNALATLAYEGRRASFFRKELLNALKIVDSGHITLDEMLGSWAGAMGQCQFMPSSFLSYARDGNGDGRKDIWNTREDVFASIANYLSSVGWNATLPIAVIAKPPKGFDISDHLDNQARSLGEWLQLGVDVESNPLLTDSTRLKLVKIGKGNGSGFVLASGNFDTLMNWNRSTYFVATVARLSNSIRE